MELPKFVLADNTDFPEDVFIIHLDFPRFIFNVETEETEFLESIDESEETELQTEMEGLVVQAIEFFKRENDRFLEELGDFED